VVGRGRPVFRPPTGRRWGWGDGNLGGELMVSAPPTVEQRHCPRTAYRLTGDFRLKSADQMFSGSGGFPLPRSHVVGARGIARRFVGTERLSSGHEWIWLDRCSPRAVMLISHLVCGAALAVLTALAAPGGLQPWHVTPHRSAAPRAGVRWRRAQLQVRPASGRSTRRARRRSDSWRRPPATWSLHPARSGTAETATAQM
jgi:hypothetical protein